MDRHRVLAESARDNVTQPVLADIRHRDTLVTGAAARLDTAELADSRLRAVAERQATVGQRWPSKCILRGDTVVDQPLSTCQPTWQSLDLVQPRSPVALVVRRAVAPQKEVTTHSRLPESLQEEPRHWSDGPTLRDGVRADRWQGEAGAQVFHLQSWIPQQEQHQGAPKDPHGRETVQVRGLRESIQAEGTSDQASTNSQEDR